MQQSKDKVVDDYSKVYGGLSGRAFPSSSGKAIQIAVAGRTMRLGFEEYVEPGQPAEGLPTLVFIPGSPGTRFFTHPLVKRSGHLPGFRLIVLERPGFGLSDPWPQQAAASSSSAASASQGASDKAAPGLHKTSTQVTQPSVDVAAFAPVFEAFCSALSLDRVLLVAYSAGTPYALAAACKCRSGLVQAVALVGAIAPPFPGIRRGMALFFQFGYWACTSWPWFVSWVVMAEGRASRRKPLASLRETMAVYSTPGDKACLAKRDEFSAEALFLESLLETGSRFQEETNLSENLRVARPWGFSLADIKVPVAVWQGEQDLGCTKGMAEHLHKSIPGCQCTFVPGKGHMAWFEDAVLHQALEWLGRYHKA